MTTHMGRQQMSDSTVPGVCRPAIKSLSLNELGAHFATHGEAAYRAKQITDWLYKKCAASFDEMTDLPAATRRRLAEEFTFVRPEVVRILGSKDTTRKYLFRLGDGSLIESVLIPASPALYGQTSDRRTICVSTQVGCAYGCKFCASGLDGFSRNLDASEIVDQLLMVEKESGEKIDNIVFMGMGEPLANLTNLLRAIGIINAPWGLEIGARHITISTSGLAPQIRRLAREQTQFRLAISLHGATDEVRNRIMPVNRKYNLATLLAACDEYVAQKKRLMFEYILIAGVNDAAEQAHQLAKHARRLSAKVNLIPYNTVEGLEWSRPSRQQQEEFLHILRSHGIVATLRREKGHDIDAACGQLRLQTKRLEEREALA
jgi:23S rRNA (adenine2503-C2)-methyltransferase